MSFIISIIILISHLALANIRKNVIPLIQLRIVTIDSIMSPDKLSIRLKSLTIQYIESIKTLIISYMLIGSLK